MHESRYSKALLPDTVFHLKRVSAMCVKLAMDKGLNKAKVGEVGLAGLLHDLGKFMVPVSIINNVKKLSVQEYGIVKIHSQAGALMAKSLNYIPENIIKIIYHHHERWDGFGYPLGLKSEKIPLGARILSVADTIDALSSDRPYRQKMLKNEVIIELQNVAGSQLDPSIVESSIKLIRNNEI